MLHLMKKKSTGLVFLLLSACGLGSHCSNPDPISEAEFDALYKEPLRPPNGSLEIYHLGHSLVGKDMPTMLKQLAGEGHSFASQLGWGANLREHWEPDVPVKGFAESNTHEEFRDPHEAMSSGDYDAVILTETVEIRDSIKYQNPQEYLRKWVLAAWETNPQTRVYLYETWHKLDDPEGWLTRLDRDLKLYWETEILRRTLAHDDVSQPIYVIPGGQVMAAFARRVEAAGGIGPIESYADLFSDQIHFNDYGAYLIALTHYAVLYGRSPVGLPYDLKKNDLTNMAPLGAEAARAMQETVWSVVLDYPPTGVSAF